MTDLTVNPEPEDQREITADTYPDLRAFREARGLELRDIYERTRISVFNLEAIEKGQFDLLPAPVFARPFIRSYASAIGVEGKIILDAYERHVQSLNDRLRQSQESRGQWRMKPGHYRRIAWVVCAAAVLIIVIYLLARFYKPDPEPVASRPAPAVLQAPDPKPAETPPLAVRPPAPPEAAPGHEKTVQTDPASGTAPSRDTLQAGAPIAPAQGIPVKNIQPETPRPATPGNYHLLMQAREEVWIRIRADRNRPEQMILKTGGKIERFAAESFTVDIGNAGGIDIVFQGKPVGSPGKRGEVVQLRFP